MNLFEIEIQGHNVEFKTYYFDEQSNRINQILNVKNIRMIIS